MSPPPMVGVAGRLSRHPSLRQARNGQPFATAGVVVRGRAEQPELLEVVGFGPVAVALAELRKGDRVVVAGRVEDRRWVDPDGTPRSAERMVVAHVGRDITPDPGPPRRDREPDRRERV